MAPFPHAGSGEKVALVTGGASGMGRIFSLRMARAGTRVAVVDVDEALLAAVAKESSLIHPYRCDVSDAAAMTALALQIEAELGVIERVVCCAAIMPAGPFAEMTSEAVLQVMRVNYGGTVNAVKAVLAPMLQRRRGDVIIFGSIAGVVPMEAFGAYGASKAATNFFAEVLFHEHKNSGLRFLLVAPSTVDTPLVKQALRASAVKKAWESGRMAKPERIIDRVEAALEKGTRYLYPGEAAPLVWLRRILPGVTWRLVDKLS